MIAGQARLPTPEPNELQRLEALAHYGVLDTPPERAFDRLTALAARLFSVPVALVSLVDSDRQFFKSCFGTDLRQTDRNLSFCSHAILKDEVMVVPDAKRDPRFADNALVTGSPHIRFYAGAPLRTPTGVKLGTLCVIDTAPRPSFGPEQQALLTDLAEVVVEALEHRRLTKATEQERLFLQTVLDNVTDGIVACNAEGELSLFNRASRDLHGLPGMRLKADEWSRHYDLYEADGATPLTAERIPLYRAYTGETVQDVEIVVAPKGEVPRQLRTSGQSFRDAEGKLLGAVVAMRDITAERQAEAALRRSEAHYRQVISTLHEGVVQQDAAGRVVTCNAAAERILSLSRAQLKGCAAVDEGWAIVREDGAALFAEARPPLTALWTGTPQRDLVLGVRKPGSAVTWILANTEPLFREGEAEPYAVVSSFADITELKKIEAELRHSALHDALTGLPTRVLLTDRLERALARSARHPENRFALLYLDLDGFKAVNDTLGHRAGDELLVEVAKRLRSCVRDTDTVARFGGDEFVILFEQVGAPSDARRLAQRVLTELNLLIDVAGTLLSVGASVGVALSQAEVSADDLLAQADAAMYRAKQAGKARYVVADPAPNGGAEVRP
jgi:diguanylate cyclase